MKFSTYLRWITAWWIAAAAILVFGAFANPALAQQPNGVINSPIYATGYISQVGGTNVTTKIPPQPNHPANLNVYSTSAISGTWTIQLPNPAFEGQILTFNCGSSVTTILVTSSDGSTIDSAVPNYCSAISGFAIQFDQRSNVWRVLGALTKGINITSFTPIPSQWLRGVDSTGAFSASQPAFTDISGSATASQLPAFAGGDCTSSAGTVSLNCTKTGGVAFGPLATETDSVNLTGGKMPSVDTIAALKSIAPTSSARLQTEGYYSAGDGGGTQFYASVGQPAGTYVDNGGTIILPTGGDGSKAWLATNTNVIYAKQFGAKGDGSTDDTAAIQQSINVALADPATAKTLVLDGVHKITSSLIVNRSVGTTTNDFIIDGHGHGQLYATSAIAMFDSNLTFTTNPVSERLTFKNITFKSNNSATLVYAMTHKFLRVKFVGCSFYFVGAVNATIYTQTWHFDKNYINAVAIPFFKTAATAYNLVATNNDFEMGGGDGFVLSSGASVDLTGNTFESGGRFFYEGSGYGVHAAGNYFEANTGADFTFSDSGLGGVATGISYVGNFHIANGSSPTWPVVWGNSSGYSGGNYSNANLIDDSATPFGNLISNNDFAVGTLNRSTNPVVAVPQGGNVVTNVTPHVGGGQPNATQLVWGLSRITTSTVAGTDSVKLPNQPTVIGSKRPYVVISNQGPYPIQVFGGDDGAVINFSAGGVTLISGAVATFYNDTSGRWAK